VKNLNEKTAVITGAGSGIGRALALNLAEEGCHLAISDINQATLSETENLLKDKKIKVYSEVLDVSNKEAMQAYPEKVIQNLGEVHILINNAGVSMAATVEEHKVEDYEWLMGINFWGVLFGTKYFLPYLQESTEAHIVNLSSLFGLISNPNQSSYNAAKFAVRGFTDSLRQELRGSNIGVTCIHPGGIRTNLTNSALFVSSPGGKTREQFCAAFDKYAGVTPDKAAKAIIKGIKKKKVRVLIGPDAIIGDIVQRIMPQRYSWIGRLSAILF
jgi:short-subunit dehydrogenase